MGQDRTLTLMWHTNRVEAKKAARPAPPYAAFVKSSFAGIKAQNPSATASAVMPLIAAAWKEVPAEKKASMSEAYKLEVRCMESYMSLHAQVWLSLFPSCHFTPPTACYLEGEAIDGVITTAPGLVNTYDFRHWNLVSNTVN